MDHGKTAILATLCYSDIFDYPLTKPQLWRYLLTKKHISFQSFERSLQVMDSVEEKNNIYFLSGKSSLVIKRKIKQEKSLKKLAKAKEILAAIAKIPSIECIGISGSLAMQNADEDADIDIFLITQPATLWVTRLLVLLLLQYRHLRRERNAKNPQNSICVNMLLDIRHLAFSKKRQDIYTAHEIIQMQPVYSKNYAYEKFLKENAWVREFLPNSFPKKALQLITFPKTTPKSLFSFFEPVAKYLQLWYMKRHRTTETIEEGFVAFHPLDYKEKVLEEFKKRKHHYGI